MDLVQALRLLSFLHFNVVFVEQHRLILECIETISMGCRLVIWESLCVAVETVLLSQSAELSLHILLLQVRGALLIVRQLKVVCTSLPMVATSKLEHLDFASQL